jgi:hypothetical protein
MRRRLWQSSINETDTRRSHAARATEGAGSCRKGFKESTG